MHVLQLLAKQVRAKIHYNMLGQKYYIFIS